MWPEFQEMEKKKKMPWLWFLYLERNYKLRLPVSDWLWYVFTSLTINERKHARWYSKETKKKRRSHHYLITPVSATGMKATRLYAAVAVYPTTVDSDSRRTKSFFSSSHSCSFSPQQRSKLILRHINDRKIAGWMPWCLQYILAGCTNSKCSTKIIRRQLLFDG